MTEVRAKIELKEGTVTLEGEPEIILNMLNSLQVNFKPKRREKTLRQLLMELMSDRFLEQQRTLTEIKAELERRGFRYDTNTIFPEIYRNFLKSGLIQRVGERKTYRYFANPSQIENVKTEVEKMKIAQQTNQSLK